MNKLNVQFRIAAILLAAIVGATGCNSKPAQGVVAGVITLDGKPLETGTIRLSPLEGAGNTAGGSIESGGNYSVAIAPGKYRVEISATALRGGKSDRHSGGVEAVVQLVPEKYNTKSQLSVDVTSGRNEHPFNLESR